MRSISFLVALALVTCGTVLAEQEKETEGVAAKTADEAQPKAECIVSRHQIRIDGKTIPYTATVGWLVLKNDKDEPIARFGYTAYTRDEVEDAGRWPVTFAFNGGPGSSSLWLHMGILGPQRAVVADGEISPPGPFERVSNAYSILDVSDLVMLDPVGTGFSKPLGDATGKDFWGVDQDIRSVSNFIKAWVTRNSRWRSPKYILGESYGGMRAAGVVYDLQTRLSMSFNGVVLVSPFLAFADGVDGASLDLPHVLFLPTLAATAWYHETLEDRPADLQAFMDEVTRFAYDVYAPALLRGDELDDASRRSVAAQLARYTGTTEAYWLRANLRVSHTQFLQEFGRDEGEVTGRIDSRFVGPMMDRLAEQMDYDPFFPAVAPPFTAAFLDYLRDDLKWERDEEYVVSAELWRDWDWKHQQPGLRGMGAMPVANTAVDLARAMDLNPHLAVLIQQGWFDVATPFLATRYAVEHMPLTAEQRKRIQIQFYPAGHMMYVHPASMEKFKASVDAFIDRTSRLSPE